MPIIRDTTVYACDMCGDKFLDEDKIFIIDGLLDFAGANFGMGSEVSIICPTCFLSKMFKDTGNMEALMDLVDQHEDEVISEDDSDLGSDDFDWDAVESIEGEEMEVFSGEDQFNNDEDEGEEDL
jgi:hypothetical protein